MFPLLFFSINEAEDVIADDDNENDNVIRHEETVEPQEVVSGSSSFYNQYPCPWPHGTWYVLHCYCQEPVMQNNLNPKFLIHG